MKNQLSIKDISNIPKDALVELVAELTTYDKTIHKKVQKLALSQNPKDFYKSILKDINSIKRGRKFIEYGKSFEFAKIVKNIVEDIKTLVKDDKEAASLLKALILTDSKVYLRSDDSAGAIQDSYAFARDVSKQSKYYTGAIWALKEMVELEAKNQPIKWKIERNSIYLQRLLKEHKLKKRFIELFDEAFG